MHMHVHLTLEYVIVKAQLPGIYGSKPIRVQEHSPRTRAVYIPINREPHSSTCKNLNF